MSQHISGFGFRKLVPECAETPQQGVLAKQKCQHGLINLEKPTVLEIHKAGEAASTVIGGADHPAWKSDETDKQFRESGSTSS